MAKRSDPATTALVCKQITRREYREILCGRMFIRTGWLMRVAKSFFGDHYQLHHVREIRKGHPPMTRILALLALTACTPTAADWPEGRGAEPPAQVWHGQPEPNPPSQEWHGQPEPNPPSIDREATNG